MKTERGMAAWGLFVLVLGGVAGFRAEGLAPAHAPVAQSAPVSQDGER